MNFFLRFFWGILLCLFIPAGLFAGITGKIAGFVRDAADGEPLIGANVLIEGTTQGASADIEGYFFIVNVSPGTYTLIASYIGYTSQKQIKVKVRTDLTTELNFKLQPTTMELQEVQVVAKRAPVVMDRTFASSTIDANEIEALPITNINEVIEIQAGVVDGHFRGGRKGEVIYLVDGVSVTDVYDGELGTEVNTSAIQELQVISGTFNAEYGQAMSGVVNIVTREGGNSYHGRIASYTGDYLSSHDDIFMHIDDVSPAAIQDYELSLSGPVPQVDDVTFFINGRYSYDDGWLYGQQRWASEHSVYRDDELGEVFFIEFGDDEIVSMNRDERIYGQSKITWRLTPKMKLNFTSIYSDRNYKDYDHWWKFVPKGDYKRFRKGRTQILHFNHVLSSRVFYNLNIANNFLSYRHYVYKDIFDSRYVHPDYSEHPTWALNLSGTKLQHFYRFTDSYEVNGDLSYQATKIHFLRAGFEFNRHEIFFDDITLDSKEDKYDIASTWENPKPYIFNPTIPLTLEPEHDRCRYYPIEAAIYVQDKIELPALIVNIGMRMDYFDANAKILRFPNDPDPYDPRSTGLDLSLEERLAIWYKDTKPDIQISPRVGIAYPISDRGVMHFAYGYFFQRPTYESLYTNPEFEMGRERKYVVFGNPDLNPEKTVTYEFGLQQEIAANLSAQVDIFARDIRNLTSTDKIVDIQGGDNYTPYVNRDFGQIRGITLSLDKLYANNFSAFVDYTFQIAQGNASDRQAANQAERAGREPEKKLVPLNWDRRHTLNAILNYSVPNDWGFSIIGKLGSGLPYTTESVQLGEAGGSRLLRGFENDGRKPGFWNVDLTAYKSIPLHREGLKLTLEAKILNLFDTKNENDVYRDTGRATYSQQQQNAHHIPEINTPEEYWTRPDWYSRPRQVRAGLSFEF